jgi:hypothetical protein
MMTRMGLDSMPGMTPVQGLLLVGQWDADVVNDLRHKAALPVQQVDRLAPSPNLDTRSWTLLLPRSVSDQRAAAARTRRYTLIGLCVAVVVALAIAAGILDLNRRTAQADELDKQLAEIAVPAAGVKKTAARWKAMSEAIDARTYPMLQLAEVTQIMPPSGINLRNFVVKSDDEIQIRCEARDVTTANGFLEDLKKHKTFSRYTWSMPQPQVRDNKTASCRIQGKLTP